MAAYHDWLQYEQNKINALQRKTYSLFETTSTAPFLQLGVHSTLEKIAEAQRAAQLERLSTTQTGRRILASLGCNSQDKEDNRTAIPTDIRRQIEVDQLPKKHTSGVQQGTALGASKGPRQLPRKMMIMGFNAPTLHRR